MESAYRIDLWQNLFVALCGASAALAGLLFIATSLHVDSIANDQALRTRAAANTYNVVLLVIEAAVVLVPQPTIALGAELCVSACGYLVFFFPNVIRYRQKGLAIPKRAILVLVLSLFAIGGGTSLILQKGGGMYLVTARFLASLALVIFNAWSLLMAAQAQTNEAKNVAVEQGLSAP